MTALERFPHRLTLVTGHYGTGKTEFSVNLALALAAAWSGDRELVLFTLFEGVPVYFHVDALGRLFVTVVSLIWVLSALFAFVYMKHEGKEKRYYGFYLILYGVLVAHIIKKG